ncbi:hypothetical protein PF008_g20179 [Phytophthora fragariae]|uniref:Secreted protein n=1 Tax=Phytophthora fragariae TaxID=53985 RepID=A0A6G0R0I4_9STRA|nr:hypothetical protein PF008_g20179 [Phytophthora fragariae]
MVQRWLVMVDLPSFIAQSLIAICAHAQSVTYPLPCAPYINTCNLSRKASLAGLKNGYIPLQSAIFASTRILRQLITAQRPSPTRPRKAPSLPHSPYCQLAHTHQLEA